MVNEIKLTNVVPALSPVIRDTNIVFRDHWVDTRELRGDLAMTAVTEVKQALNAVFGYGGAYTDPGSAFIRL